MDVKMENGKLVITIDVQNPAQPSASGKTLVVATTRGNVRTGLLVDGKPLTIGLNAYIPR